MNQNTHSYFYNLCNEAKQYDEIGELELAFHYYHTAVKFYTMRNLNNTAVLCDALTRMGDMYYSQWLKYKSVNYLSGASDCLKIAIHYNHVPACETFGLLSMQCGNFQEAIQYLNKAAQGGRNVALNYRRIGICYNQIDDYKSTIKFWRMAYCLGDQESYRLAQTL
jgi:tetratricopeptide (TPR) repeat protein